jgi:hypothetical protein
MHQFAHANKFAADDIEFAAFEMCLQALDGAFLDYQRDEVKKTRAAAKRESEMNRPKKGVRGRRG